MLAKLKFMAPLLMAGTAAVGIASAPYAVADAYATAVGNMVRSASDIDRALAFCATQSPIRAAIIIIGDRIGFRGDLELTPMNA